MHGDPAAGTFMTGFFPVMMFGLPAAAIAMWREARPEKRTLIGGIMISAALASFLTGITEPIEFAFLFVAPVLYAFHVVMTGVAMVLMETLGAKDGFGFSAGFIDYALNEPVPWTNDACRRAGTVHVVGTFAELVTAGKAVAAGQMPERPFVLVAQPSLFDPTRAPAGKHTLWVYAHVPNGYTGDATEAIEQQIERFAPGFRDTVLQRREANPSALEEYNPNYIGGDIAGGAHTGLQLVFRPTISLRPYATPNKSLFLCSASTPPGAGVHGMCGWHAAEKALNGPLRR